MLGDVLWLQHRLRVQRPYPFFRPHHRETIIALRVEEEAVVGSEEEDTEVREEDTVLQLVEAEVSMPNRAEARVL